MVHILREYNPPDFAPPIIFADDTVLVVDKPSGLLSVPGKGQHLADCLEARVRHKFEGAKIVHRLDMETSGVMVMGLTKHAHRHLSIQFEKRKTYKTYRAVLWGKLCQKTGMIDLPMICDWPNRPLQKIDFEEGKQAETSWEVLGYRDINALSVTDVRFYPKTGRSHQLRLHAKALGHPILGDALYAHEPAYQLAERLQLHAETLVFRHPVEKRVCGFNSFSADFD